MTSATFARTETGSPDSLKYIISPFLILSHGVTLALYHLDSMVFSPEIILANNFLFLSRIATWSILSQVPGKFCHFFQQLFLTFFSHQFLIININFPRLQMLHPAFQRA